MPYFYLVSRCRKDDSLYGHLHGTWGAKKTLCGKEIDWHWWIIPAIKDPRLEVTCKKCLKAIMKEDEE